MGKLRHLAITVPDPEKAAEFYIKVFGLRRVGTTEWDGASGVYLTDGVMNLALLRYKKEEYAGKRGREYVGAHHFGFIVDDVGSTQLRYSGAAWMAVQKPNGPWVTIEPKRLEPRERRGPRTYSVAVESPGDPVGNGRPPIASTQIQPSPNMVTHTARDR